MQVVAVAEAVAEAVGGRVGGIARAVLAETRDQVAVELDLVAERDRRQVGRRGGKLLLMHVDSCCLPGRGVRRGLMRGESRDAGWQNP